MVKNSVPKDEAVRRLEAAGARVSDYEYNLYADGECGHCGSHFTYGSLEVNNGAVDSDELQTMVEHVLSRGRG